MHTDRCVALGQYNARLLTTTFITYTESRKNFPLFAYTATLPPTDRTEPITRLGKHIIYNIYLTLYEYKYILIQVYFFKLYD